ncbi:hypothetical protein VTJ04DRAFT_4613 [Mycothermus thermophilus]|uniref:uncharacterized protein n=1 Tax=Humicola insolens TaxID=85995 RepID=UPI003742EE11
MMKAVRRNLPPLWAETGSESADAADASATGQAGGMVLHGSATPLMVDHEQGHVSDLALRLPTNATIRASQGTTRLAPQNADIPPVTFPGGRNPYVDRPLPLPPSKNAVTTNSRKTTSTTRPVLSYRMPMRPSTSSGPGSSKTADSRPNFNKRLSKDDMALPTGFMSRSKSTAVRNPWTITPEPSPRRARTPSPPRVLSPPLMTPQSATSGEIPIGMALGSPTRDTVLPRAASPYVGGPRAASPYGGGPQAALMPQTQVWTETRAPSPMNGAVITTTVSGSPPPAPTPEPTLQRSKTQKRRLFGLFGSRKHAENPKVGEKAEANRSAVSVAGSTSSESVPMRSNTVAGTSRAKHKPIVIKKQPEAKQEPSFPTISRPILPGPSPKPGGFLDVEIPDIRLERYSVMFSGVLNPNGNSGNQNNNNGNKSLLERRQATLEKLKNIGDDTENHLSTTWVPTRRATSPQPMKSPTFSLFPSERPSNAVASSGYGMASTTSLAPPPVRGLQRSNTSPAYLPSPSRATFANPSSRQPQQDPSEPSRRDKKTVTVISPRTMDERNRAAQVERLRAQQQAKQREQKPVVPNDPGFYFGPNNSTLVLDSPHSIDSEDDSEDDDDQPIRRRPIPASMKPYIPEPEWEIIAPPSTNATRNIPSSSSAASSASSASSADSASTAASSVSSSSTKPTTNATQPHAKHAPSASTSTTRTTATGHSSHPSIDTLTGARISVDEEDAALKHAVEISIARQISISRQQHRLLRPFQAKGGQQQQQRRGVSPAGNGNGPRMPDREEVTIGIIKGRVTPVMVGPPTGAGEHRRSERVVLDVA